MRPAPMLAALLLFGPLAACSHEGASPAPTAAAAATAASPAPAAEPSVRLYALDCGRLEMNDMGFFTEAGKPNGMKKTLADPCFLIQHPKGTLLWDTGFASSMHDSKDGIANPIGRTFVDTTLVSQLKQLSLTPADITFVGFSHLHADHAGNANLFTSSTWLLNHKELDAALKTPAPMGVEQEVFSNYRAAKTRWVGADGVSNDVFGDGTVTILQTPGHTPGHQSLELHLAKAGVVILSGDLAHTRENWEKGLVPSFNPDKEASKASLAAMKERVAKEHARFVVQHSAEDFHALPQFPAYLE